MRNPERMKHAFKILLDTSFGTLWWVDNVLWQQEKSFVLKPEQEKGNHPGVCIRQESNPDPYVAPMLLGRSKKHSVSKAVKLELGAGKFGYFGTLKPVRMSYMNFFDGSIHVNQSKPELTSAEKDILKKFIKRRLSWSTK